MPNTYIHEGEDRGRETGRKENRGGRKENMGGRMEKRGGRKEERGGRKEKTTLITSGGVKLVVCPLPSCKCFQHACE